MFSIIAAISLALAVGCGGNSPVDRATVQSAEDDPASSLALHARVDLGVLEQGETNCRRQWLVNRGGTALQIGRIESSCECLTVELARTTVEPGEGVLAEFRYDGSKEPEFVGSLVIEVEVWDHSAMKVGELDVPVEVIADQKAE